MNNYSNALEDLYLDIQRNGLTYSNIEKINDYADQIISGKSRYTRFEETERETRGFKVGGKTHVAASLLVGTGGESEENAGKKSSGSLNLLQENLVKLYSIKHKIWYANTDNALRALYGNPYDRGTEAFVWYDVANGVVIKSKDTSQYFSLQEALDSITLYNSYLPAAPQHILGFGKNSTGEFQIIINQPYIQAIERKTTQEERDIFAKENGFYIIDEEFRSNYRNRKTCMNDLHEDNVLIALEGVLIPIDAHMTFYTEEDSLRVIGNEIVPL